MAATKITTEQMRCIYGLARKANLDNDTLHVIVARLTQRDSIKLLTGFQGKTVIDELKRLAGQESTGPYNRATKEQVAKIYALAGKLGWSDDPARLRGFIEKRYNVSHPRFLDDTKSRNCIEAMKAMLAGGRSERKGRKNEQLDG